MPKVPRRLRDDERKLIRSGSVFVFDEHESGIKRWTDGLLWSPSRILWNFLVSIHAMTTSLARTQADDLTICALRYTVRSKRSLAKAKTRRHLAMPPQTSP